MLGFDIPIKLFWTNVSKSQIDPWSSVVVLFCNSMLEENDIRNFRRNSQ